MGLCVSTSTRALCKQGMTLAVVGTAGKCVPTCKLTMTSNVWYEWAGAVVYTQSPIPNPKIIMHTHTTIDQHTYIAVHSLSPGSSLALLVFFLLII